MNKLTEILATKAAEVAERRKSRSVAALDAVDGGPVRGFAAALEAKIAAGGFGLIAKVATGAGRVGRARRGSLHGCPGPGRHQHAEAAQRAEHLPTRDR